MVYVYVYVYVGDGVRGTRGTRGTGGQARGQVRRETGGLGEGDRWVGDRGTGGRGDR